MVAFGAQKPKATIKSLNKTAAQALNYTEWHDLQVNAINRFHCILASSHLLQVK